MLAVIEDDESSALDWRLSVLQRLLLTASTDLPARQAAAELLVRTACMRWRYRVEFSALRALERNRTCERLLKGRLLTSMPTSSSTPSSSRRRSSFGDISRATELLSLAEMQRRRSQLDRGLRGLRNWRLGAISRVASAPMTAQRRLLEHRAHVRRLHDALGQWRSSMRELRVLDAAVLALRQHHCAPCFGWIQYVAAFVRAKRASTRFGRRRLTLLRLLGHCALRRWAADALCPRREEAVRGAVRTRCLASGWRALTSLLAASRCMEDADAHASRRHALGALAAWREAAADSAVIVASTSLARVRIWRRHSRRVLGAAVAEWTEWAAAKRALRECEHALAARHEGRLLSQCLRRMHELVERDAFQLAAWGELGADGAVMARAPPALGAFWRRWRRRWGIARQCVGMYLELLCRIGRSEVRRALHNWRLEAETANFFALQLTLACQTLAMRRFVHRMRRWCYRAQDDKLRRAMDWQQRVASALTRARGLWRAWAEGAAWRRHLSSGADAGASKLLERRRKLVHVALRRLQAYADARRHMLLVRYGRALLRAVRLWAGRANQLSHGRLLMQTARQRGRRRVLFELLRGWCMVHAEEVGELSRRATAEYMLLGFIRARRMSDGLHAWRMHGMMMRADGFASACAVRRWRHNGLALDEAAQRTKWMEVLANGHARAFKCVQAMGRWQAPLQHRNARASAFAALRAHVRAGALCDAFGAWRYSADFHNAFIIVVHRGRRLLRESAIDKWRAHTIFHAACFLVTYRHTRRALALGLREWRHTTHEDSAINAILRQRVVPRWRRRCVTALRTWLGESSRRLREREMCTRCRTTCALRKLSARCAALADFRTRLTLGRALTAHRMVSGCVRDWHFIASALRVVRSLDAAARTHYKHLAWHNLRLRITAEAKRYGGWVKLRQPATGHSARAACRQAVALWAVLAEEWRGVVRPSQLLAMVVRHSQLHPPSRPLHRPLPRPHTCALTLCTHSPPSPPSFPPRRPSMLGA
jgi:hypothetical protein